jgi:hypothetical protein
MPVFVLLRKKDGYLRKISEITLRTEGTKRDELFDTVHAAGNA